MRHTMPREFYIPSNETVAEIRDTESDAVAFTYDRAGVPYALAFSGKRQKPDFHFRFRSPEHRASKIAEHAESRRRSLAFRAEQRAKRLATPVSLKVGDVLKSSWGYDQTNVDFFEVTALVGSTMVEVRAIAGNPVAGEAWATGTTTPKAGAYIGEPLRRRVSYGQSVRIDDCRIASPWNGKPASWTAYA